MLALTGPSRYPTLPMTTNHFKGPFLAIPLWAVEVIKERGQTRDLQVLVGLVGCMDIRTKTVVASFTQIAEYIGVSRETVKRSMRWLVSEGIVSVTRTGNSVNHYTVSYRQVRGVTGDPPGGHGRPYPGSRETLPTEVRGVTGDPTKIDLSPAQVPNPENTEIYTNREVLIEKNKSVPCGDEEDEMILGGDPERVGEKPAPTKTRHPRSTYELADRFMFHPKSLMTQTYTPRDRVILMGACKKLLEGGLTRPTVVRMIDRFWSHPKFSAYTSPAEAFASRAVQKDLLDNVEVTVHDGNPILTMMANDFTRQDEHLPWDTSADRELGKAVMMRCMDACYRYPEVVADIAMMWNGEFKDPEFLGMLDAFNSLVRWHCSQESIDFESVVSKLSKITLPSPLLNTTPTMLRAPAGTIEEAVYNYRRFGNG